MNSIYCAGGSRLTLDWQNPLIFCGIGAQSGERIDAAFRPRSRGRAAQLAFAIHLSAGPGNSQRAARFHCHRISPAFSLAMPAEPRRHGRRQFYPAIWTAAKVAGESLGTNRLQEFNFVVKVLCADPPAMKGCILA